jgi:hypothetical protein
MRTIKGFSDSYSTPGNSEIRASASKENENGRATLQCASNYELLTMYSNTNVIAICKECDE